MAGRVVLAQVSVGKHRIVDLAGLAAFDGFSTCAKGKKDMRVVINGAGIAGTALAYWLSKLGHRVMLVEQAPGLRDGGYVVNLWGIGYDAAERMGILPRLLELQYQPEEIRMVDRRGRTRGGYSPRVLQRLTNGRIASLARSDIAATIFGLLDDRVEMIFGDSVSAIEDDGVHVKVEFEHAPPCTADLVIGADGLHSHIRQMTFGPDSRFEYSMGCHVAAFEASGYRPRDETLYVAHSAPGRYISKFPVRGDKMLFFMLFRDKLLNEKFPASTHERKAALAQIFSDMEWECPEILSALEDADDVYFDSISQIRMDAWTKGRVALLGDAAACPSLIAGEGAGFALAEAYVLAGEIHENQADLDRALARYEERMKSVVTRKQKSVESLVPSFVPKTDYGVSVRDFATLLMRLPVFPRILMGRYLRDEMQLPDYSM